MGKYIFFNFIFRDLDGFIDYKDLFFATIRRYY